MIDNRFHTAGITGIVTEICWWFRYSFTTTSGLLQYRLFWLHLMWILSLSNKSQHKNSRFVTRILTQLYMLQVISTVSYICGCVNMSVLRQTCGQNIVDNHFTCLLIDFVKVPLVILSSDWRRQCFPILDDAMVKRGNEKSRVINFLGGKYVYKILTFFVRIIYKLLWIDIFVIGWTTGYETCYYVFA